MPTGTRPLPGPLSVAVGSILADAIKESGKSQAKVAEAATMSAPQLSRALRGAKVFTLDQLDAVCLSIGVRIEEVIKQATDKIRPRLTVVSDEPDRLPTIPRVRRPVAAKRGQRHTEEP